MRSVLQIFVLFHLTISVICDDEINRKLEELENKINNLVEINEKQGNVQNPIFV